MKDPATEALEQAHQRLELIRTVEAADPPEVRALFDAWKRSPDADFDGARLVKRPTHAVCVRWISERLTGSITP